MLVFIDTIYYCYCFSLTFCTWEEVVMHLVLVCQGSISEEKYKTLSKKNTKPPNITWAFILPLNKDLGMGDTSFSHLKSFRIKPVNHWRAAETEFLIHKWPVTFIDQLMNLLIKHIKKCLLCASHSLFIMIKVICKPFH